MKVCHLNDNIKSTHLIHLHKKPTCNQHEIEPFMMHFVQEKSKAPNLHGGSGLQRLCEKVHFCDIRDDLKSLKQRIQEVDQQVLVRLGTEDTLEAEIGQQTDISIFCLSHIPND